MSRYRYTAKTRDGKTKRGMMQASDENELHRKLKADNLYLISFQQMRYQYEGQELSAKELSDFSRELGSLMGAGISLNRVLSIILHEEQLTLHEKNVYELLQIKIRQGMTLSEAMEAMDGAFPPMMVSMYRAGETGGKLESVALRMADFYEKEHRMNGKIKSSMIYPRILGILLLVVVLVMVKFILPKFATLFAQMENLPLSTRILMGFGNLVTKHWVILLIGIAAVIIVLYLVFRIPAVHLAWHRAKLHLPVVGRLQKIICTSRFARTLSSLYAAGIPIVSCLPIAGDTIGNDYIVYQFDELIGYVRGGHNLSDGLEKVDGFIYKLCDSVRVGEETGKLDELLLSISDSLEYDADLAIGKLVSYMEPMMLLVLGGIVAFVMIAVFSALYGSYGAMMGV